MSGFDGAGNLFNKYESKNPVVRFLVRRFFSDLVSIITPIRDQITEAYEVGCGEGYIAGFLHRDGIPVEGSDVSERIIGVAKKNHPEINFFVRSVYDAAGSGKRYSLVIANEVFEHLSDPDRAVEELKKVTKRYILITVPHEPFFRMANILRLKYLMDLGNTPGHLNHWSRWSIERFLVSHSLTIRSIRCSTLWLMVLCELPREP